MTHKLGEAMQRVYPFVSEVQTERLKQTRLSNGSIIIY